MDWLWHLDGRILIWIQENLRNDFLTPLVKVITHLGDAGIFWMIVTILMLFSPKTRKIGITAALAMIISLIINNLILKNGIARTRPYEVVEGLTNLIGIQKDYSFPSGHTAASFAAAITYSRYMRLRYGIFFLLLASAIGFSRLYVGVHYPTDVLFGILSAWLCAWLAEQGMKWWMEHRTKTEAQ